MRQKRISADSVREVLEKNPFEKLSNIVFRILEEAILSSELSPGERLNVAKIAGELEVSATPVREAIDQLCTKGLVRVEQKGDGKYSNYYVFDISNASVKNLFVARKSIEGAAAYLCAEQNWRVDLDELGSLAEEFQRRMRAVVEGTVNKDKLTGSRLDMRFHKLLINATENEFLISMYGAIEKMVEYMSIRTFRFNTLGQNTERLLQIGNQHVSIYHAIKLGFPELARSAMDKHIDLCANSCLQNRGCQ